MASPKPSAAPRRRWPWRMARAGAWATAILLAPLLVLLAYNRIDVPPSADALRLGPELPRAVPDEQNAWLMFAGIGAPAELDPLAYGRRRVAALQAGFPPADPQLFDDAVPAVEPVAGLDGSAEYCPTRDTDCLRWSARHRPLLQRMKTANALRLQRFERVLQLSDWQALYPPDADVPHLDGAVPALRLNLIALALWHEVQAGTHADSLALQDLADTVTFWRRVQSQPQDVVSILVASRQIENALRVAGHWLDHRISGWSERDDQALQRIFQAPTAPIGWGEAMRREHQYFARAMDRELPGPLAALRRCIEQTAADGCFTGLAISAAYAPQATRNLDARHRLLLQRALEAPAHRQAQVDAEVGAALQASFPQFDDVGTLLRQLGHNYAGRVLAVIAIPAYDWGRRVHDQEALRRMLVLKRDALAAAVAPAAMADFLAAQAEPLRNPHDLQPFAWDPLFHEIHFEPATPAYWKRPRIGVTVRRPPTGVAACERPLRVALTEVQGEVRGATVELSSCAVGNEPLWSEEGQLSDPEHPKFIAMRRLYSVEVREHAGRIGVRVLLHDGERAYLFEKSLDADTLSSAALMDPIGHDGTIGLHIDVVPTEDAGHVAVNVVDIEVDELATRVAAAKDLQLRGTDRLGRQRVTLRADIGLQKLLDIIADEAGLMAQQRGPGVWEFLRPGD
jgi:hypothetical protein